MANLFLKQAKQYAATRPAYPPELFDFIASKTPRRDLAWDVGTGSGQAAVWLAKLYKSVVGTDTSAQQLAYAPPLPNVRYVHTPPDLSLPDLHAAINTPPGSADLVTVAQAFHWLDLPRFYAQVRSVLRPGHGVLAAWCYTEPRVDAAVDDAFWKLYRFSQPYWAPNRRMVDDEYRSVEFPFDPVDGEAHTGPFEFSTERRMDLDDYLTYITSWSAYQTAKEKGVELLDEATVRGFQVAWGGQREEVKTVRYPIFLRIGKYPEGETAANRFPAANPSGPLYLRWPHRCRRVGGLSDSSSGALLAAAHSAVPAHRARAAARALVSKLHPEEVLVLDAVRSRLAADEPVEGKLKTRAARRQGGVGAAKGVAALAPPGAWLMGSAPRC